jgi:putative oxidoreductase
MPSERSPAANQWNAALLLFRLAGSLPFLYHGSAILFGVFGGPGPEKFAASMHAPATLGYLVGLAQVAGGVAILTGALIRAGSACIVIVMLGAIFLVHLPHGYNIGDQGMEYALTQLFLASGFLIAGAGDYSLRPLLPSFLPKL